MMSDGAPAKNQISIRASKITQPNDEVRMTLRCGDRRGDYACGKAFNMPLIRLREPITNATRPSRVHVVVLIHPKPVGLLDAYRTAAFTVKALQRYLEVRAIAVSRIARRNHTCAASVFMRGCQAIR